MIILNCVHCVKCTIIVVCWHIKTWLAHHIIDYILPIFMHMRGIRGIRGGPQHTHNCRQYVPSSSSLSSMHWLAASHPLKLAPPHELAGTSREVIRSIRGSP